MLSSVLLGYVIGSLPTAYLLVRWKSHIDIRRAGSGNVGTLNSFEVSHSWLVGGGVLIVDLLKGAGAALVGREIGGGGMTSAALGGLAAVLGHNYPVWLGFRGGRGLAPGAGVSLVLWWPLTAVWTVFWAVGYAVLRSVNPASAFASGLILVAALVSPASLVEQFGAAPESTVLRWFIVGLMMIILLRLVQPVKEYLEEKKRSRLRSA